MKITPNYAYLPCICLIFTLFTTNIKAQVAFDSVLAKQMLEVGDCTIKGEAFSKAKAFGKRVNAANTTVFLYPMTPYLEAYLIEEKKKINTPFSKDALKFILRTKTDENGNFTFVKMKPGKYFVEIDHEWIGRELRQYYLGTTETVVVNGGEQVVGSMGANKKYDYKMVDVKYKQRHNEVVELKKPSQTVNVKLHKVL